MTECFFLKINKNYIYREKKEGGTTGKVQGILGEGTRNTNAENIPTESQKEDRVLNSTIEQICKSYCYKLETQTKNSDINVLTK